MRRVNQSIGVVFILAAALLAWNAAGLVYYSRLGPGPGFFPLWLCGLLAVLSVAVLVQASVTAPEPLPGDFFTTRGNYLRIAAVVLALVAMAFLMRPLGFRLAMLGFFLVMLPLLGRRNPLEIVLLAAVGSFGTYYVFGSLLGLALPVGPFDI